MSTKYADQIWLLYLKLEAGGVMVAVQENGHCSSTSNPG